ncbi:MAG: TPM domain-containing protein [Propionibacteriaceae bacterium]|jgi:uncharacterized protein|nr:TPM domain-containing protein [Propionibacteriaceae bacterium]
MRWRRFFTAALAAGMLVWTLLLAVPTSHAAVQRLFDEADLFSQTEEAELNARLNEISDKHSTDIVMATVYSLEGKSARLRAADFYEDHGFPTTGAGGAVFLVSMEVRDWGFACVGGAMDVFTNVGQGYLSEYFLPDLRQNRYFDGFMALADAMDDFYTQYEAGTPYGYDKEPVTPIGQATNGSDKETFTIGGYTIGGILAAIIGVAVPARWRSQLKTVRPQANADQYVPRGGFKLTGKSDVLVNKTVSRTRRPQHDDSSSHSFGGGGGGGGFSSSSGTSWSGSSGKF